MFRASLTFNGRLRALKELNSPDWVGKGGEGGHSFGGTVPVTHPPTYLPKRLLISENFSFGITSIPHFGGKGGGALRPFCFKEMLLKMQNKKWMHV